MWNPPYPELERLRRIIGHIKDCRRWCGLDADDARINLCLLSAHR